MSADIEQKPGIGYNKTMSGQLVAKFDLQGNLVLSHLEGQLLNLTQTLATLKQERTLNKELAVVWVPTQQVLISQVNVPGKRKAHWQAALPFSLEEGLTQSVDDYHIVAYDRNEHDEVSAAAVNLHRMKMWTDKLAELGLNQAQLVPDCFRIPFEKESEPTWLVYQQESMLARTGLFQGFAASQSWYTVVKQQAQQHQALPISEHMVVSNALLCSSRQDAVMVAKQSLSQGEYGVASETSEGWMQWRGVMVLSALLVVVWLGMQVMHNQQVLQQADSIKAQTETLFKNLFPNTKRIVNIKAQTMSKLRQGGEGSQQVETLTPLLHAIEPWFANNQRVKLVELTWNRAKVDSLTLQVQAPKSVDIENLVKRSEKPNSTVTMRLTLKNVTNQLAEGVIYVSANE